MTGQTFIILLLAALLIGLAISFPTILKIMLIRRISNLRISSLPDSGLVKLSGHTSSQPAVSLVTHLPCVFWRVEVEEYKQTSKTTDWHKILEKSSNNEFEIADDSGNVTILPEKAEIILDRMGKCYAMDKPNVASALNELGVETTSSFGGKRKLRISEWMVRQNEPLFIMGKICMIDSKRKISGNSSEMMISDTNERAVLASLYNRIAIRIIAPIVLVLVIFIFMAVSSVSKSGVH
jgi:hypothetical protein